MTEVAARSQPEPAQMAVPLQRISWVAKGFPNRRSLISGCAGGLKGLKARFV